MNNNIQYSIKGTKQTPFMEEAIYEAFDRYGINSNKLTLSIVFEPNGKIIAKAVNHKKNIATKIDGHDFYSVIPKLAKKTQYAINEHEKRHVDKIRQRKSGKNSMRKTEICISEQFKVKEA